MGDKTIIMENAAGKDKQVRDNFVSITLEGSGDHSGLSGSSMSLSDFYWLMLTGQKCAGERAGV